MLIISLVARRRFWSSFMSKCMVTWHRMWNNDICYIFSKSTMNHISTRINKIDDRTIFAWMIYSLSKLLLFRYIFHLICYYTIQHYIVWILTALKNPPSPTAPCSERNMGFIWVITANIPVSTILGLMSEPPHTCWSVPLSEYLYIPTCHGNSPTLVSMPFEINGFPLGFLVPHTVRTYNWELCVCIYDYNQGRGWSQTITQI